MIDDILQPFADVFLYPLDPINVSLDNPVYCIMLTVLVCCGIYSIFHKIFSVFSV